MKKWIKKIPIVGQCAHALYYVFRKILNTILVVFYKIYRWFIKHGIIKNAMHFEKMKSLKGKYEGKRCFLVCTGPSLRFEDLETLHRHGEYTFSVNTIVKSFPKTFFRPSFYCIQDAQTFNRLKNEIYKYENDMECLFVGVSNFKLPRLVIDIKDKYKIDNYYPYRLNILEHWIGINYVIKNDKLFFSEDCALEVNDGSIVAYSVFQIAKYMGFKEIYIIGADCDYTMEINHFDGAHLDYVNPNSGLYHITTYEKTKRILEGGDFKIYNATRGGKLDVFPRVSFDDLF